MSVKELILCGLIAIAVCAMWQACPWTGGRRQMQEFFNFDAPCAQSNSAGLVYSHTNFRCRRDLLERCRISVVEVQQNEGLVKRDIQFLRLWARAWEGVMLLLKRTQARVTGQVMRTIQCTSWMTYLSR
jgi:hypothetical protein